MECFGLSSTTLTRPVCKPIPAQMGVNMPNTAEHKKIKSDKYKRFTLIGF